ncbi:MAG: divalent metal cation transporter, partial [Armatimonadetes bacterium]|nr:divalent metal cation transporter [Armatimonadota bacterium]
TFILILSVILVLIPKSPLISIMVMSQTLNGMLLPFILITMLLLINNQKIMGKWKNSFKFNLISWIFAITLSALSLMLIFSLFI